MSPLEQNIINLLPTLSDEAKSKARFILGENPSFNKQKKTSNRLTKEQRRVIIRKALKI